MHDNISSKRQRSLQNNYIIFGRAVKLIQTKWMEISYVITETKVKISFSFQNHGGTVWYNFLMTVESGDWVSNPLLGVWNFALKGFLWVLNKEMALIFLWTEGERARVRFWGIKSQVIHYNPWCFWKPVVSVKVSQSDFQIVTRIFFPIQNT